jgi:hypothetical protein
MGKHSFLSFVPNFQLLLFFGLYLFFFVSSGCPCFTMPPPDVGFLKAFQSVFPNGLSQEDRPADLPDFSSYDLDQLAAWLKTRELGCFKIPLENLNTHLLQHERDPSWVVVMRGYFDESGAQMHTHPGCGILNTPCMPRDTEGNPDPLQMSLSVVCTLHCACAQMTKDDVQFWVFTVWDYGQSFFPLTFSVII